MKVGKAITYMLAFSLLAIPAASLEVNGAGTNSANMPSPIVMTIRGGLGMTITIWNASGGPLPGTEWSVELKGLIFSGASFSGTIDTLVNKTTIKIFPVGIGPGSMTIIVGNMSASATFFMAGPFVLLLM